MDDLSDISKRRQMEYATQLFGFPPEALVDRILGEIKDIIGVHLRAVKQCMHDDFGSKVSQEALDDSFSKIHDRYVESAEEIYFKFGRFIKENLLCVPANVCLPTDAPHDLWPQADAAELAAKLERFDLVCQKILRAKLEREALKKKKAVLEEATKNQMPLLKRVRKLKEQKKEVETFEKEVAGLKDSVGSLMPLMQKLENNLNTSGDGQTKSSSLEMEESSAEKRFKR